MTQTDPPPTRPANRASDQQRDLPDRLQSSLEGLRDRIGANKAVAATAAVVALVLLIAIIVAVVASGGGEDENEAATPGGDESSSAAPQGEGDPAPTLPADGAYLARQESTGLCVTDGPEPGNPERSVMVLGDCAATYPASLAFTSQGAGVYTVGLDFTEDDWQACWGADDPADQPGYLSSGQDCADSPLQQFQLTGAGADSYTFAVVASGLCLGLLEGVTAEAGAALATATCDPEDPNQRFALLVP
ncbi:RICIN domain-containing protein [Glycomyces rhizosphaerae]|uniref:RICIN domain-containing protein n=1 Tax=Glycomyces rhizosphaerae TaxID=2054422 RepID=A0ABV7PSS7_9ACTN